jgi:Flp pilus assembly protein CpaB
MLRRSPRTALAWAAAAVVALVTATTVLGILTSLRHQDEAFGTLHPIAVARRDLAVGRRVTAGDLTHRSIRGEAPERDALTEAQAIGRVVRVPVLRGATLTARHLVAGARDGLGGVVPAGRRAMRLVVEHGLRPETGDVVDVLATFDPATLGDSGDPTVVIAPGVPVVGVDTAGDAGDTVAVTVLVTPHQSTRLAFATAAGTVSLALAPPEAATGRG